MKLNVNIGATACLQAVFFRQFNQHCLQASSGTRHFVRSSRHLLLLFRMIRMFAAPRAEFFYIQFLAARLAPQGVIQIAVLFARQKHHFRLFFAFGHNRNSNQANNPVAMIFCRMLIIVYVKQSIILP
jgi:hypothetical protein